MAISSGTGKSGASLSGTTKVAAVAGIATFSGLSIDSVATGYRLTASAPGLTSGTSASFSIVGPAGIGEPSDPGSGYLWADNFDRYASVLAMQNSQSEATYGTRTEANNSSSDVVEPGMALVTGRGGSGKALSATYPPGFVGSRTWLSPWGNQHLGSYSGTLVVQFYMRVSAGGSSRPIGGKYFEIWWASGASQRIQYAPSGGNDANGGLFSAVLGANPGGTVNRTPQPIGPYWNNINDGVSWVRVTLLFKPNTSSTYSHVSGDPSSNDVYTGTSSRDGRVAMWINGIKIMDYSQATVGVTPPGGANPWCYQSDVDMIPAGVKADHFQFPDYANSTASGFTIDHDDLKVWTIP